MRASSCIPRTWHDMIYLRIICMQLHYHQKGTSYVLVETNGFRNNGSAYSSRCCTVVIFLTLRQRECDLKRSANSFTALARGNRGTSKV